MSTFDGASVRKMDYRQTQIAAMEPEYKVPASWAEGPVQNRFRKVTDKCCLIIFLIFFVFLLATGIYAFIKADPKGIRKVYDSSSNVCGEGAAVDYPLLYLQTFTAPYVSVCVKSCPSFDYNAIKYGSTANGSLKAFEFNAQYAGLSHTKLVDMTEVEAFGFNADWVNGYFTKSQWDAYLASFNVDCLTNNQVSSCKQSGKFHIYDSYPVLNTFCEPLSPKAGLLFNRVESKLDNGNIGDMVFALPIFGYTALLALGISLIFLIVVTCCPWLITWLIFIGTGALLITAGGVIIASMAYTGPLNDSLNPLRVKYLQFFIAYKVPLIIFGVVLIFAGLMVFILMCKHRKSISAAIPLIKIASRTTLKNPLLILLSVFILALQFLVLFLELLTIIKIYALGTEVRDVTDGSPFVTYEDSPFQKFLLVVHAFGLYWLIVVLNNFNDFVCSAIAVNFYWFSKIENIRVFCHTLGHSIGTIAMSIFILPTLVIKICFGWLDFLTSSDSPNCFQRAIRGVLCPCCWLYENFVDVISESAFAVVYMGSENFWPANKRFYYLSEKYYDLSSTISFAGILFQGVGKALIVIGSAAFGYTLYKRDIQYQQNIDNIALLVFVCGLIGFAVGSLFVNLFSTTYDSMVACFLVEQNIQDMTGRAITNCPPEVKQVLDDLRAEKNSNYHPLV